MCTCMYIYIHLINVTIIYCMTLAKINDQCSRVRDGATRRAQFHESDNLSSSGLVQYFPRSQYLLMN